MANLSKYIAFGSLMLFSFFQGMMNIYIGGTEEVLGNIYHFRAPVFTALSSYLFLGNGIGCIIGGTLIDRYGAGTISSICGIITTIGIFLFTLSHNLINFYGSEFIIGLGVSVWYPAGIEVLKIHFEPKKLPLLAGMFLFCNALGSASISFIIYLSKEVGLIDTDYTMLLLSLLLMAYLFATKKANNPTQENKRPESLISAYYDQILLMRNRIVIPVIISQTLPTVFSYVFLPLWAIPYLSMLLSPTEATFIVTGALIIYGISGMLLGELYHKYFSPLGWMMIQFSGSFIAFTFMLYLPEKALNFWIVSSIIFTVSVLLGANNTYLATYLADLFEPKYTGAISAVYGYVFQFLISAVTPLFGMALSSTSQDGSYSIADYNYALQYLLLSFAISTLIIYLVQQGTRNYPKIIKLHN